MRYLSTRGAAPALGFDDVLLAGLAADGGLYVPESWPGRIATPEPSLGYAAMAAAVLAPFVEGSVVEPDLEEIVSSVYSRFDHPQVAPVVPVSDDHVLLELFWGPTLSFKDYALGVVGAFFDRVLRHRQSRALILGATSGDTGSAAMAALAGRSAVDVVILYPEGRISEVQRRQMTTLTESNVHAVAVEGTFDDCQDLVKAMFTSPERDHLALAAVNSINWVRIAAQAAYHVWAARTVDDAVTVAVPTGNFGNVMSAEVARRIGASIERMVVATNANHGTADLIESGRMRIEDVRATVAPAMDIAVPSNLERYLFDLFDRDAAAVSDVMRLFRRERTLVLDEVGHTHVRRRFRAQSVSDEQALATIAELHRRSGRLIDPHTAIAWACGDTHRVEGTTLVTIATAHPAKFGDAVEAATGVAPDLPPGLAHILERPERSERIPADRSRLRDLLMSIRSE